MESDACDAQARNFQTECVPSNPIWFVGGSDVNAWTAIWEDDGLLSYLSFSQG